MLHAFKIDFRSYKTILFCAIIVRLLAAIFSEGYGMHDDHFLVIEAAGSWVDGFDYNLWLPWTEGNRGGPEGHSFTYVGINFLYFYVMKFLGFSNPMFLMLINRILHALFSVLIVVYGIKITEKLSSKETAISVGWVLALLWLLPFLSVRNLVELVGVPFLMIGFYLLIREKCTRDFFFAGLLMGLAVSFRYQIGVFLIGIAMYYFFKLKWKEFSLFCAGVLVTFIVTQGIVDYFIWGYPFAEFWGYTTYNMKEGTEYMKNHNYFMYFYVLFGVLFIPLGLMALVGFFTAWKRQLFLFIPTFLFLAFHTLYPNRQERFITTILPFVIILSFIGISYLKHKSTIWKKLWKVSLPVFWVLNIPLLIFFTSTSSKSSRVSAMYSLYNNEIKDERILLEATGGDNPSMMPKFYAKSWNCSFEEKTDPAIIPDSIEGLRYDYIFFIGNGDLEKRKSFYTSLYPKMKLHRQCFPSLMDRTLHAINPRNSNEYIEVWKTNL